MKELLTVKDFDGAVGATQVDIPAFPPGPYAKSGYYKFSPPINYSIETDRCFAENYRLNADGNGWSETNLIEELYVRANFKFGSESYIEYDSQVVDTFGSVWVIFFSGANDKPVVKYGDTVAVHPAPFDNWVVTFTFVDSDTFLFRRDDTCEIDGETVTTRHESTAEFFAPL